MLHDKIDVWVTPSTYLSVQPNRFVRTWHCSGSVELEPIIGDTNRVRRPLIADIFCLACSCLVQVVLNSGQACYHLVQTVLSFHMLSNMIKGKALPLQAWTGPWGSRMLRLPEYLDSRHMKVTRLSALCTGRFYPQGRIPGTDFVTGSVDPRVIVRPEGLSQCKI